MTNLYYVRGKNKIPPPAATMRRSLLIACCLLLAVCAPARAEDGYDLWLRYRLIADRAMLAQYRAAAGRFLIEGDSPTLRVARDELAAGLTGLLGVAIPVKGTDGPDGLV